jgi:chloramphenicol O-acetyltransferase
MNGWIEIASEGSNKTLHGYVNNISLSGAAIYIKEFLASGTSVVFSLHFYWQDQLEFVRALQGKVISCVKADQSFKIRVCFQEPITRENEPDLFAYLTDEKESIRSASRFQYRVDQVRGAHVRTK